MRQLGWGVPRLDDTGAAAQAIAELTALDFPESALRFGPDGAITGFARAVEGREKPDGEGNAIQLY